MSVFFSPRICDAGAWVRVGAFEWSFVRAGREAVDFLYGEQFRDHAVHYKSNSGSAKETERICVF